MNLDYYQYQRVLLLITIFISKACKLNAQDFQKIAERDTSIYVVVDSYPKLITSEESYEIAELSKFINKHIQWPKTSLDCQGRVFISFIIEKDGSLSSKKFAKRLCSGFDEEAMKIIELMRTWQPGIKNKKAVRTLVTVPINFNLK